MHFGAGAHLQHLMESVDEILQIVEGIVECLVVEREQRLDSKMDMLENEPLQNRNTVISYERRDVPSGETAKGLELVKSI